MPTWHRWSHLCYVDAIVQVSARTFGVLPSTPSSRSFFFAVSGLRHVARVVSTDIKVHEFFLWFRVFKRIHYATWLCHAVSCQKTSVIFAYFFWRDYGLPSSRSAIVCNGNKRGKNHGGLFTHTHTLTRTAVSCVRGLANAKGQLPLGPPVADITYIISGYNHLIIWVLYYNSIMISYL